MKLTKNKSTSDYILSNLLTESSNMETPEVYTKLKDTFPNDRVQLFDEYININLRSENSTELYGDIYYHDKLAKLAMPSGPNPLEPSFLEILNKVSEILQGYTMEHY